MRKSRVFALATAVHLVATIGALLAAFSLGFSAFDGHPPHPLARSAGIALSVLQWPLLPALEHSSSLRQVFPGLLGYIPFAANSALWGTVATLAVSFRHRCRNNRSA